ncbi:rhodanese-like domain-containing protein [Stieleria magnilauensis]|uniref:rhodanese-like domain-containing protein n=1 Tax=Stieleria magnilauensis TaxID=2527963 RepID=UPI003AF675BA
MSEVTDDKDARIVVYCAVGGRAEKAKAKLEELGITNVENGGGFDDVKDRFQ